jgi:hypothetical protein
LPRLFLITLLLLLSSGPAYAEWMSLGSSKGDGGYAVYVDPDTVRRKGDLVKMWLLLDFKTEQTTAASVSYLSSRSQRQFDCTEERYRIIAFTHFSGNMGSGNAIITYTVEDTWTPVAPGSVNQRLWEFACGKK